MSMCMSMYMSMCMSMSINHITSNGQNFPQILPFTDFTFYRFDFTHHHPIQWLKTLYCGRIPTLWDALRVGDWRGMPSVG